MQDLSAPLGIVEDRGLRTCLTRCARTQAEGPKCVLSSFKTILGSTVQYNGCIESLGCHIMYFILSLNRGPVVISNFPCRIK